MRGHESSRGAGGSRWDSRGAGGVREDSPRVARGRQDSRGPISVGNTWRASAAVGGLRARRAGAVTGSAVDPGTEKLNIDCTSALGRTYDYSISAAYGPVEIERESAYCGLWLDLGTALGGRDRLGGRLRESRFPRIQSRCAVFVSPNRLCVRGRSRGDECGLAPNRPSLSPDRRLPCTTRSACHGPVACLPRPGPLPATARLPATACLPRRAPPTTTPSACPALLGPAPPALCGVTDLRPDVRRNWRDRGQRWVVAAGR